MLGYYTRDFRSGHVEAAVDYLTLICLDGDLPGALGKNQADLCHEALRELILETREFAQLLGDIQSDGTRIRGAIEERVKLLRLTDQEDFLRTITIQAASVANDNGRTTDAVLLYHLAEDYDNVIVIINNALSEAIAVEIGDEEMRLQPLKPRVSSSSSYKAGLNDQQQPLPNSSLSLTSVDDPAALARNMISLYNSNALYYQKIRPANRDACGILLRLSEVKAKVSAGNWAEALDVSSKIIPIPPPSSNFFSDDRHPPPPPLTSQIIHPHHPFLRPILQRPPIHHLAQHRTPAPLDHHLYWPPARDSHIQAIRWQHPHAYERRVTRSREGSDGFCRLGQISSWREGVGSCYEVWGGCWGLLLIRRGRELRMDFFLFFPKEKE